MMWRYGGRNDWYRVISWITWFRNNDLFVRYHRYGLFEEREIGRESRYV